MDRHSALKNPDRLKALQESGLSGPAPEQLFDRVANMICRDLNVPIAMVSLVDCDRQIFKGQAGLSPEIAQSRQTPISTSICKYVVENGATIVIDDARIIEQLKDHPAIKELNVVAYLGAPLVSGGHILGSVCAIDTLPRKWSEDDIQLIEKRANFVRAELYARKTE